MKSFTLLLKSPPSKTIFLKNPYEPDAEFLPYRLTLPKGIPNLYQSSTSSTYDLFLLIENIASASCSVRPTIGLSLFTNIARASNATLNCVGGYPYLSSNLSNSLFFIARLIGASCAVASMRAGGAVEEPLPSIDIFTVG